MRRREFIAGLGGAGAAWPFAARAQQPVMPVVGFLGTRAPGADPHLLAAFHGGLKDAGYVEGQNVLIEYRLANNQYERLPALAADLVRRHVAVIAAPGNVTGLAAKASTSTIPVVFLSGDDPIKMGLVASLNRPGGNLTGVSQLNTELGPKRLELLREVVPTAAIIAVLLNPANPSAEPALRALEATAPTLGVQLYVLHASSERDFDNAFKNMVQQQARALVIGSDPFLISRIEQLAALTVRHSLPAIYQFREFAAAGGLMSYGGSLTDAFRQVGFYTGRILKGEKPADMPVQQATKVELIINLKTAKALGLSIPLPLLGRADEVIE